MPEWGLFLFFFFPIYLFILFIYVCDEAQMHWNYTTLSGNSHLFLCENVGHNYHIGIYYIMQAKKNKTLKFNLKTGLDSERWVDKSHVTCFSWLSTLIAKMVCQVWKDAV